jgi:hypothetical protein
MEAKYAQEARVHALDTERDDEAMQTYETMKQCRRVWRDP